MLFKTEVDERDRGRGYVDPYGIRPDRWRGRTSEGRRVWAVSCRRRVRSPAHVRAQRDMDRTLCTALFTELARSPETQVSYCPQSLAPQGLEWQVL